MLFVRFFLPVVTLLLAHTIRNWFRLRHIPGPLWAKVTDLWRAYHYIKGDYGDVLLTLHKRYGDLVRTGPNSVNLGNPSSVPVLYRTNPTLKKGNFYISVATFQRGREIHSVGSTMDEEIHTRLKRPMAPYFAIPSLLGMESAMDEIQQELEDQICRRVTIDVVLWMRLFSLESLYWIAFSNKLGYLSQGNDADGVLSMLQSKFMFACYISTAPIVGWLANYVAGFIGPGLDSLFPKAAQELQSRRRNQKPKTTHRDLLAHFMDASQKDPETLEEKGVLGATISTIFAGSDTTGTTLTFLLYYLVKHPAALARLREELDSAVRSGNLSYPPKWTEVSTLNYLQAVFKETLRLHSTARMSLYRVVGPEGLELCGERLPSGTNVGCFGYTAHRNEPVYGRDAGLFRPERWIEASNEEVLAMERAGLWFGHGKHGCVGKNLTRMTVTKLIARLLIRLDISAVNVDEELGVLPGSVTGYADHEYYMTFKERIHVENSL